MYLINGKNWYVVKIRANNSILRRSDGSRTVGACNKNNRVIYISDCLYGAFLKKVLLHELSHAYMFEYNVNLSVKEEEIVCDIIANYGEDIVYAANTVFRALKKAS